MTQTKIKTNTNPPLSTLVVSDDEGEENTLFLFSTTSRGLPVATQRPVLRLKGGGDNGLLPLLGFSEASLNINQVGVTQSHPPKDQFCDSDDDQTTGCFFNWYPPKKLKYGKPRLGESTAT